MTGKTDRPDDRRAVEQEPVGQADGARPEPARPGDVELVLSYRPRARSGDLVRSVVGAGALVVFLGVFVAGLRAGARDGDGVEAVLELVALGCAGLAAWALPAALRHRRAAREDRRRAGPVLRLNRDGVQFQARDGGIAVSAPWEHVERCEFRPAPGGSPRWCVDAPIALPPSLSFAAAWAGMVPLHRIEDRVVELSATWATLGAPADRHLLYQALLFGTPIVVDLSRCADVSVPQLDAAVRAWTFGRCGCDPSARPSRWPRPDQAGLGAGSDEAGSDGEGDRPDPG